MPDLIEKTRRIEVGDLIRVRHASGIFKVISFEKRLFDTYVTYCRVYNSNGKPNNGKYRYSTTINYVIPLDKIYINSRITSLRNTIDNLMMLRDEISQ